MAKQSRRSFLAALLAALAALLGFKSRAKPVAAAPRTPVLLPEPPGPTVTLHCYDAEGRLTMIQDLRGPASVYHYDAAGKPTSEAASDPAIRALADFLRKRRRQQPPQA